MPSGENAINAVLSVRSHLIAVKGLNVANLIFHFLNDLGVIRPVVGQEVDHPHSARFANIQIQRLLAVATLKINKRIDSALVPEADRPLTSGP